MAPEKTMTAETPTITGFLPDNSGRRRKPRTTGYFGPARPQLDTRLPLNCQIQLPSCPQARRRIDVLEHNEERPASSLNYRTPHDFRSGVSCKPKP